MEQERYKSPDERYAEAAEKATRMRKIRQRLAKAIKGLKLGPSKQ
ncbi:MAG TPA: hypothetical protein PK096_00470 [Candidatus Saccharibacteria bacterium]|nr:hypothetical protein [Candidatus Saccharibacteria bacterium]HRK93830.1 hypothetical protein [Candidatus Saccharibacteria bacterium]